MLIGEQTPEQELDPDLLGMYTFATWGYKQGEMVSLMIHLGHRLGIYEVLDGAGPVTAADLAERTGLHGRWLLEWLRGQAAARLLVSEDGEAFLLEPEAAAVLARPGERSYAAGVFSNIRPPEVVDALADAFRTGIGVTYDGQGEGAAHQTDAMLGPMARALMVPVIVPALEGVAEKLTAGARVVDVGCGAGTVLGLLAEAFPASTYVGYDPSHHAVDLAVERLSGFDNVEVLARFGEELPPTGDFDLILTMDCLHDMPRPDIVMAAIREAIAPDGTWLIKDIKSSADWTANRRNPMLAMMYATSVASCLSSAMSAPDSLGLGTLGLNPDVAERMTAESGFTRFTCHDFDDPVNLYYEVRP
ncbi:MAG TPA: class I SAM-dependent methyltransferase [Acidimicrobiia bacterium]|nr:class I SAM-dependent methyltransferase [Acidimicrobiia bacterium]